MEQEIDIKSKNQKSKNLKIIILAIIILIAIGGLLFYKSKNITTKSIFQNAISEILSATTKNQTNKTTGNVYFKYDDEKDFNLDLSVDFKFDMDKKIVDLLLDSKLNKEELIKMSLTAQDNNAYLNLHNIFNKLVKTEIEEYDQLFEKINNEDSKIIVDSIKKALNDSLEDKYFTKKEETLTINGKKEKVEKHSLVLNETNTNELFKSIAKKLKEDKKFVETMSKINKKTETDVQQAIDDFVKEDLELTDETIISIYVKGVTKDFVAFDIVNKDNIISVTKNKENNLALLVNSEQIKMTFDITEKVNNNKREYVIKGKIDDEEIKFEFGFDYDSNKEINKIDVSNSVDFEELTDSEVLEIYMKIMENETLMKLVTLITNLETIM